MKRLVLALLLLLPVVGKTEIRLVRIYALGLPKGGVLLREDDYALDKAGCLRFTTGEAERYFSKGVMGDKIYYIVCGPYTIISEPR